MKEQTQAVNIKRRRSRAEIQQLMAEFEASGLSRTAFCQRSGLSVSTLSRYQKRQEQKAAEGKRWLAVEVSGSAAVTGTESASGVAIVLRGGQRIEVGRGFDAGTLQRLLAVVERG